MKRNLSLFRLPDVGFLVILLELIDSWFYLDAVASRVEK